jgi:hypothetical protein
MNNGQSEQMTDGISIPHIFLDGHNLRPDHILDLPFAQVFAVHSLVVICHKSGRYILPFIDLPANRTLMLATVVSIAFFTIARFTS